MPLIVAHVRPFFADTTDNKNTNANASAIRFHVVSLHSDLCADFIALDRVGKKMVFLWSFLVLLDRHSCRDTHMRRRRKIDRSNSYCTKPSHSKLVRNIYRLISIDQYTTIVSMVVWCVLSICLTNTIATATATYIVC